MAMDEDKFYLSRSERRIIEIVRQLGGNKREQMIVFRFVDGHLQVLGGVPLREFVDNRRSRPMVIITYLLPNGVVRVLEAVPYRDSNIFLAGGDSERQ